MQTKLENLLSESYKQTEVIRKIRSELQTSKREKREGVTDVLIAQFGVQKVLYPQSNIERHPHTQAVMVLAQRAGISQNEIASLCGVSQSSVSQWTNGDCRAKLSSLIPLLTRLSPCFPGEEFHRMDVAEFGAFELNHDWEKNMLLFFAQAVTAQRMEWSSLEEAFAEGVKREADFEIENQNKAFFSEIKAIENHITNIHKKYKKYSLELAKNRIEVNGDIENLRGLKGFPDQSRKEYLETSLLVCDKYNLNENNLCDFDGFPDLVSRLEKTLQSKHKERLQRESELRAIYDKKISDGIPIGEVDSSLFLSAMNVGFDRFSEENVLKLGKQLYGNSRCSLAIKYCGMEFSDYELNDFLKAPDGDFLLSNIFAFWLFNGVFSDIFVFKPVMLCGKLLLDMNDECSWALSGGTNIKLFRLPSNRLALCQEVEEYVPTFRTTGSILNLEQETQTEKVCFLFSASCADELLSCVEQLDSYFPDDYGRVIEPLKNTLIAEGYCIDGVEAIY